MVEILNHGRMNLVSIENAGQMEMRGDQVATQQSASRSTRTINAAATWGRESSAMDRDELIAHASQSVWCALAVPDSASALAEANIQHGIAKILATQQHLGLPVNASFIGSPDLTPPRQKDKWQWGLAIGGRLQWGDGTQPLVFLDPRVNTSTALVANIEHAPSIQSILEGIDRLRKQDIVIDGLPLEWDIDRDNHFLNVYRVASSSGTDLLSEFVVIVHGGESEVRKPNALGWGLDYRQSLPLREQMLVVETPFGPTRVLTDDAAREYYAAYLRYQAYSEQKRRLIAEELFPGCRVISNETHHGYANMNTALIGAYTFDPSLSTIYPITLRSDIPAYLVKGTANVNRKWVQASLHPGVMDRIATANILPHGGGYTFPEIAGIDSVLLVNDERFATLRTTGGGQRVTADLGTIPFVYRGEAVMNRVREWHLGEEVASLMPIYSITT